MGFYFVCFVALCVSFAAGHLWGWLRGYKAGYLASAPKKAADHILEGVAEELRRYNQAKTLTASEKAAGADGK